MMSHKFRDLESPHQISIHVRICNKCIKDVVSIHMQHLYSMCILLGFSLYFWKYRFKYCSSIHIIICIEIKTTKIHTWSTKAKNVKWFTFSFITTVCRRHSKKSVGKWWDIESTVIHKYCQLNWCRMCYI